MHLYMYVMSHWVLVAACSDADVSEGVAGEVGVAVQQLIGVVVLVTTAVCAGADVGVSVNSTRT